MDNAYASVSGSIFEFSHGKKDIYICLLLLYNRSEAMLNFCPFLWQANTVSAMSLRSNSKHLSLGTPGGMPENQLPTNKDDQLLRSA